VCLAGWLTGWRTVQADWLTVFEITLVASAGAQSGDAF